MCVKSPAIAGVAAVAGGGAQDPKRSSAENSGGSPCPRRLDSMPKPTIEFTPISQFQLTKSADDPDTGDKTMILTHPPGQEWGGNGSKDSQAEHTYWKKVLILRGRIHDKSLQQWFSDPRECNGWRTPMRAARSWLQSDTDIMALHNI
ncbi:hypothetical protein DFH07DRAFT_780114 [Mycena maculata]|uniref:Uncharacterized protein n=1 Tax=Mycena maculata TaxID=230809 RepID=A0AAD7I4X4_9AGAR|nr:hypothetical protein DFH07DRAFT_780114 [Mycena maculata]